MIRKSMPSGFDPMGGSRLSEEIMLKQKIERDDDSKKSHLALGSGLAGVQRLKSQNKPLSTMLIRRQVTSGK